MSSGTARRYLEYLAATDAIELSLRHGSTGRPEHLYRWGDGPSEEVTPPVGSAS